MSTLSPTDQLYFIDLYRWFQRCQRLISILAFLHIGEPRDPASLPLQEFVLVISHNPLRSTPFKRFDLTDVSVTVANHSVSRIAVGFPGERRYFVFLALASFSASLVPCRWLLHMDDGVLLELRALQSERPGMSEVEWEAVMLEFIYR